jgi:hypothetical protein
MLNVRAAGKIYPEFAFFLKGNLHDAWTSYKSNALQFAQRRSLNSGGDDDACHCSLASDRKKDRRRTAALL